MTETRVVTATVRLSRALADRHTQDCVQQGARAWPRPRIIPYSAWLAELYMADIARDDPPALLSGAQERAIWEDLASSVADDFELISSAGLARNARNAWATLHAWRIPLDAVRAAGTEDARVFARLASRFDARCRELNALDSARLADAIADRFRQGALPVESLRVVGFEDRPPQWLALADAIVAAGGVMEYIQPMPRQAKVVRVEYDAPETEWRAMAAWARARHEAHPGARTGIVVPDLASCRSALARTFTEEFFPGRLLSDETGLTGLFRIHAALSLSDQPMIHAALAVLDLARVPLDYEAAGRLMRSPFLGGSEAEGSARARLDASMREQGGLEWSLDRVRAAATYERAQTPLLAALLGRVADIRSTVRGKRGMAAWARILDQLVQAAGWPGERPLSRVEREQINAWREALDALASLDACAARSDFGAAIAAFRRMVSARPCDEGSQDAPIEIMSPADSVGLDFDHLWVADLRDEVWPQRPNPGSLLPIALQRRHGVPGVSAELAFAEGERRMRAWMQAADEVVLSLPRMTEDGESRPSRLIVAVPAVEPGALVVPARTARERLFDARAIEELADDTGPRFDMSLGARGGTSLLRDQSVCPFRAFAHHRLAATALAEPQAGLSPMERGLIAHGVLAVVWGELNDRNGLRSCDAARLHEIVTAATRRAIADELRGRPHPGRIFVQMEETRVADLVLRWLAIEQARTAEFRVIEREATHSMTIGELTIKGRMDRVDEFADGSRLIIDYKTGKASAARWMGERPDEPQLPAYVCFGSIGPVAGVAFGLLNRAESAFVGIARDEGLVPGVKPPGAGNETAGGAAWDETVASWRRAIEAIAAGFLSGDARVDPKTGTICKTCDLHMFCRIHEHPAGDDAMEGDDGEG